MTPKRMISWEHWKNPLGSDDEFVPEEDGYGGEEQENEGGIRLAIPTAGGFMPVTVYQNFSSNFNYWMMHTTFNLSRPAINTIERVPGVETCDVVTRYRVRIGFAKCFESAQVKKDIMEALQAQPYRTAEANVGEVHLDEATKQKVSVLERNARDNCEFWAIYVIPNGEIECVQAENRQEYEKLVGLFRRAQESAGGIVLSSHE